MSYRNAHVLVGGDFNCSDIEWSHMQVPHGGTKKTVSAATFGYYRRELSNTSCKHTKALDLLFTNAPSPVNRVKGMPPIGKADHDIVRGS